MPDNGVPVVTITGEDRKMSKVIFELKDGTTKEFDGEKFTDEQVASFNEGGCVGIICSACPFDTSCNGRGRYLNDSHVTEIAKCYRVTEEPKPVQILKRLIEGGSVWVDGVERNISDLSIGDNTSWFSLNHEHITLEKPKKKIKIDLWLNVYPNGDVIDYCSKELADWGAGEKRIACEHFVREYEA